MNRTAAAILALILLAGVSACSSVGGDAPPENLVEEDTYIHLLIELQLLRSYQESLPPDSLNVDSLKSVIFDKYGVTELQFRMSHSYYQRQVDEQKQRVVRAIDSLRMEIGGHEDAGFDTLKSRMAE